MADIYQLLAEAVELPRKDREELAYRILESLRGWANPEIEEAWIAEIERRCAEVDAGQVELHDWEEFRARIEREIFHRES